MPLPDDDMPLFPDLLVTGADGRLGRLMRATWESEPPARFRPVWCSRYRGPWRDLLAGPLVDLRPGTIVLHLARDPGSDVAAMAANVRMARNVGKAAKRSRAGLVLFASSSAVYGTVSQDRREDQDCRASGGYGLGKRLAERVLAAEAGSAEAGSAEAGAVPVLSLRLGNVLGADALTGVGRQGPVLLDPVGPGGPVRSWLSADWFCTVVAALIDHRRAGTALPAVLNVAWQGEAGMDKVLTAAGQPWAFGPSRARVLGRAVLSVDRLSRLMPVPAVATALSQHFGAATMTQGVAA